MKGITLLMWSFISCGNSVALINQNSWLIPTNLYLKTAAKRFPIVVCMSQELKTLIVGMPQLDLLVLTCYGTYWHLSEHF